MAFLNSAVPFEEASKAIGELAAVDAATFERIVPELKDAAIAISGVEGLDVVQRVRDIIARLPQGEDFKNLKQEIEDELSPWLNEQAASRRATLLLRMHGFRAYASATYEQMEEHKDAFPFRQYIATMDERTRATHRALHGIVLPADHPFWLTHTGPWEYGCRCEAVALTQEEAEEIGQEDKARNPDEALLLDGPLLAKLEQGELVRGPTMIFDVRTSREKTGDDNDFEWRPGDRLLPMDKIAEQYDPGVWAQFEAWARGKQSADGRDLWTALTAARPRGGGGGGATPPPTPTPPPPPPTPQSRRDALRAKAADVDAAEKALRAAMQAGSAIADAAAALRQARDEFQAGVVVPLADRGKFTSKIVSPTSKKFSKDDKKAMQKQIQAGLDVVGRWVGAKFSRDVKAKNDPGRERCDIWAHTMYIGKWTSAGTVAHEFVHDIEANTDLLKRSVAFLLQRAGSEQPKRLADVTGNPAYKPEEICYEDEWQKRAGSPYSGKLYGLHGSPATIYATELLTMGIERLERDAFSFWKTDEDYFWFTLETLQDL